MNAHSTAGTTLVPTELTAPSAPASKPAARARAPLLGAALIGEALLSFAPVAVLGPSIGWPASLGLPAATQLAAIHAHAGAVQLGYGLYLAYSILFAPLLIVLAARLAAGGGDGARVSGGWFGAVAAFAALSALARSIGILRWLTVMPALAIAHQTADVSSTDRAAIERLFDAVNAYGGGIGEVLGVSLLAALAIGALCAPSLLAGAARLPRVLAACGALAAVALAALTVPVFGGPRLVPVAGAVTLLSLWMLAVGGWLAWRGPERAHPRRA